MSLTFNQLIDKAQDSHLTGNLSEAAKLYDQALKLQPNDPECLYFLALSLFQLGNSADAIGFVRRAIAIDASVPEYHCDLGGILFSLDDFISAISAARQSILLRPDFPEALWVLGNASCRLQQFDDGIDAYQRLLALRPESPEALNNLGMALFSVGKVKESIECFDRILRVTPTDAAAHSNRIYAKHFLCPFDAIDIGNDLAQWNQTHCKPLRSTILPHTNPRMSHRTIRVGYVSPDFRAHVVGWNLLTWLPYHDQKRFHISCYSSVRSPDEVTGQIRSHVDSWQDISGISDVDVARLIREDQIDILVDLSLHCSGNQLLVFARKPAPIQMTYLAYPGSSGLETMDYRISDSVLDLVGGKQTIQDEQTLRLSGTYWCYKPGGPTSTPTLPPTVSSGPITFGCLNQFAKVSASSLELWIRILQQVPYSRFLLHSPIGKHREELLDRFVDGGIDKGRLEFVGRMPWAMYIETYHRIDIALDPFPYCGGITTCDSLWMGVPIISLAGEHPVSRTGTSILHSLGLNDFIASSRDEYVDLAICLAGDVRQRCELRHRLRHRMTTSPLTDGPRFARDMERIFIQAWDKWLTSEL